MTIISFIFVYDFFILDSKFYIFMLACVDCAYERLDNFDRGIVG